MRKKEKEEKKKGVMMQMQWARVEEEGLPGSGVQRCEEGEDDAVCVRGLLVVGRCCCVSLETLARKEDDGGRWVVGCRKRAERRG